VASAQAIYTNEAVMTTIVESQASSAELFLGAVGGGAEVVASIEELRQHLMDRLDESVVILGPSVNLTAAASLAETLRVDRPALSIVLVRQRVDTSVLGDALRSGMREVVEQRDLTGLSLAVRRGHTLYQALTASRGGTDEAAGGRLVTVFSAKGGVGKTTVSTNLAMSLSMLGHRVCLVDLDLGSGDVAISLQLFPVSTIVDALALVGDIGAEELAPLLTKYSDNLWTLLAPNAPELSGSIGRHMVGTILTALKQSFDYVVVDSPPAFDDHVLQAFDHSDLLLLLLTLDIPALKNLKITLETLHLLNFPREKYRIILNRADSKVGLTPGEVEKTLKAKISASIPSSHDVPASVNRGEAIVASQPKHPVSQIFMTIAHEAVDAMPNVTPRVAPTTPAHRSDPEGDKRGLFRRKSRIA
jgi:pilus assembly protein CpaE